MSANPKPEPDPDRFESATDQAIAACGGDARLAVTALIVTNEFLESEVCELTLNRRPSRPYISYKMADLTSPRVAPLSAALVRAGRGRFFDTRFPLNLYTFE
jgi:hypothetical protein